MKEQWIEDISAKMNGYEMDAPEISWSEIESKVGASRRPRIVAMWQRRIAVAASLLMIVAASTTFFFTSEQQSSTGKAVAKVEAEGKALSPAPESDNKEEAKATSSASMGKEKKQPLLVASENPLEISENFLEILENLIEPSEKPSEVSEKAQEKPKASESHTPTRKEKKKTSLDYPEEYVFKKQKTTRLMASAYYGNGVNVSSMMSSPSNNPEVFHDAVISGDAANGDHCKLESPEEDPIVNADHHQPIRIGLSVKYALSERWGVETGLAYSYLRSDISEERSPYTINAKQKVGYLGIPLAASYNIIKAKPLHLYLLAGTMLEIPVMAKADEAMVSNGVETTRQERSLSKSGLQLSFLGRLGAEYNLTPSLGIYVEPGVSYYLDNGSNIETAYSDKPFNFNLNLGVRLTIGR